MNMYMIFFTFLKLFPMSLDRLPVDNHLQAQELLQDRQLQVEVHRDRSRHFLISRGEFSIWFVNSIPIIFFFTHNMLDLVATVALEIMIQTQAINIRKSQARSRDDLSLKAQACILYTTIYLFIIELSCK